MKKIFLTVALTAFIGSFGANSFAQDGKKEVKTEKKCEKKKCCKKGKTTKKATKTTEKKK